MSIFNLGGTPEMVPEEKLTKDMESDRYFLPGVIHGGEDYVINVYLNTDSDPVSFEVSYFTKDLIKEAFEKHPKCGFDFFQHLLSESESFGCYNGTGDFAELVKAWPKATYMTHTELVKWANEKEV